jgi:hypothetical protein
MEVSPNSTTEALNMYDYINSYFMNPVAFIALFLIVVIIIIASTSLGGNSNQPLGQMYNSDGSAQRYGIIGLVILLVLVILNGFQYYYGMDFFASIKNIFYGTPQVDIRMVSELQDAAGPIPSSAKTSMISSVSTLPHASVLNRNSESLLGPGSKSNLNSKSKLESESSLGNAGEQVFNIPGNKYGYEDAKAVCYAYGGRLATYNEVESAYNDGAEWCNYGWSDRQMALFPTQKSTYSNLQNIKGHEHDCGRPGVNGGYIANPMVKFGVNCYGNKRKINREEQHLMDITTPYPKTQEDLAFEQSVSYWKTKLEDILVSPFNYNSWSKV